MTHSALYEGRVYHERTTPKRHAFGVRMFAVYLDLDELPSLFRGRWLWSVDRPSLVWFRRADYMQPRDRHLRQAVLDKVEAELGHRPRGAVRLLTQLRTFGYVFNPVSFYFCFDEDDRLEAIAAEITNTPWGERHTYVLDARGSEGPLTFRFDKDFHVSPFHGMQQVYEWTFDTPGERLEVHMKNHEDGQVVFQAGMSLERRPITGRTLAGALLRYPFLAFRVHVAIYLQAALLWWKRVPFHTHPEKLASARDAKQT